MPDRVKGITVQIGGDTTGLSKALKGVNTEIGNTQRQLKDVDRLLKLDPTNTELLRQKQELLARAVEQTEKKLDALKEAEKQVQKQFERGDIGEDQYNALKREIIETENKLGSLKTEAKEAASAIKKIDERPLEEVADAAEDAGEELGKAGKEASNFKDYLKAEAITEGAKAALGAIKDLAEGSVDYMRTMGSLEVSSQKAGYTAEQTAEIYQKLYGVLADDQTAATTTANLQALGLSQEQLISLTNMAIGAWSQYGDSIPIDGLAEAINETARTGQVTGVLADVLNWGTQEGEKFGVTLKDNTEANKEWNEAVLEAKTAEDFFNLALQGTNTESERATAIMQMLADQGLAKTGEQWQKNNENLVAYNEANAEFNEQTAILAEELMPILTDFLTVVTDLIEKFNSLDDSQKKTILTVGGLVAAIGPVTTTVSGVSKGIGGLATVFKGLATVIGGTAATAIGVIGAIIAVIVLFGDQIKEALQSLSDWLASVFVKDWTQVFGKDVGTVLNKAIETVGGFFTGVKDVLFGIIDFVKGVFTGDWERAFNGLVEILKGIVEMIGSILKGIVNILIGIVNGVIWAINALIGGLNKIQFDTPDWLPFGLGGRHFGINIPKIPEIPLLAKGGVLTQGSAIVGEAGPELLTVAGNQAIVQPLTTQNTQNTNLGGVNIFVYGSPGQDVNELAEIVSEKISEQTARKGAVFS